MSGGIYDYLCFTGMPEILERTGDMEKIEERLSQLGEIDIAQDIHELVICCNKARDQIPEMFDRLQDVFYAVEWYDSGDWDAEELKKELDKYKIEKENKNEITCRI